MKAKEAFVEDRFIKAASMQVPESADEEAPDLVRHQLEKFYPPLRSFQPNMTVPIFDRYCEEIVLRENYTEARKKRAAPEGGRGDRMKEENGENGTLGRETLLLKRMAAKDKEKEKEKEKEMMVRDRDEERAREIDRERAKSESSQSQSSSRGPETESETTTEKDPPLPSRSGKRSSTTQNPPESDQRKAMTREKHGRKRKAVEVEMDRKSKNSRNKGGKEEKEEKVASLIRRYGSNLNAMVASPQELKKHVNFYHVLSQYWEENNIKVRSFTLGGIPMCLVSFFEAIQKLGGFDVVVSRKRFRGVSRALRISDSATNASFVMKAMYQKYLLEVEKDLKQALHQKSLPTSHSLAYWQDAIQAAGDENEEEEEEEEEGESD